MAEPELPVGVVTFLLTDVQDSTGHWSRPGAAVAMARQRQLVAAAVASHGGVQPVEQGEGDSTVAVFAHPGDALGAAHAIQRVLGLEAWPDEPLAVRIGVHTGAATMIDDRTYGGPAIIRCARLRDLAAGGQVLVSAATTVLAQDELPEGITLRELATVRLKGLDRPEVVHQLHHPDLGASFPPLVVDGPPPELPNFPTSFVGRERELDQMRALLDDARLVTVTGAGGSGKTRVAHALATTVAGAYAQGVVWVDLCRVGEDARVASEAATACGLTESPGGVDAATMVALHLRSNERLLVLDNCEHVLDGAAALAEAVLGQDARSSIVATTREPLGIAGEVVWRIPSLEVPADTTELDDAAAASAVTLFGERARAAVPDFTVDHDTIGDITTICRRLDGIPLAIELAAARLRSMSIRDLTTALDDRFRLLAAGPRALERQRTLLASIDWSHDLLGADERMLLRRLGVFTSPFGLPAAEAVTASGELDRLAVFDVLTRLVDKSLVQYDDRGYSMLETIRQYAVQKAVDGGDIAELRDRHTAWFVAQVDAWGFERDHVTTEVVDDADRVLPDLRAAFEWALLHDRADAIVLLSALTTLVGFRGGYRDLDDLTRQACSHEPPGSPEWAALLAPTMHVLPLALTDWWQSAATAALDEPTVSARVGRRIEWGLLHLDLLLGVPGAADRAEALIAESRQDGDEAFEAAGALLMAITVTGNGDLRRAEPYLAWCERRYPGHLVTSALHSTRVVALVARGEMAAAIDVANERPAWSVRIAIDYLGDILAATFSRSRSMLRAIEVEVAKGEFHGIAEVVPSQLKMWSAILDGEEAMPIDAINAALTVSQHIGQRATTLGARAQVALALGDVATAEADAREIDALVSGAHQPLVEAFAGLTAASIDLARGDRERAIDTAHRALEVAELDELRWLTIPLLELLAIIAGAEGDLDRAARLLGACDAFREQHGFRYRWPYGEVGTDALRARVAPSSVDDGRAMSIDDAVAYARGNRGERSRPSFGWDALTPTELRVVDLVADGLSNQQIAEKLFVSVSTVKTHLVHVYPKLGLASRAELIAAALNRATGDGRRSSP